MVNNKNFVGLVLVSTYATNYETYQTDFILTKAFILSVTAYFLLLENYRVSIILQIFLKGANENK